MHLKNILFLACKTTVQYYLYIYMYILAFSTTIKLISPLPINLEGIFNKINPLKNSILSTKYIYYFRYFSKN